MRIQANPSLPSSLAHMPSAHPSRMPVERSRPRPALESAAGVSGASPAAPPGSLADFLRVLMEWLHSKDSPGPVRPPRRNGHVDVRA
jgi:hypothetical protein